MGFTERAGAMATKRLKWSSLLHLTELEFEPDEPKQLDVSDELVMSISWLTGCTKHDRKLLRCDENGALLIADAWSLLTAVEDDELYPQSEAVDTFTATVENKGVLIATSTQLVKMAFRRVLGGAQEFVYVPREALYWYPKSVYSVVAKVVPDPNGTASYVGITAFN